MSNLKTADRYAAIKAQIAALEELLEPLKKEIIESGKQRVEGELYAVEVSLSERTTLDPKAVKLILSEAQVKECSKVSLVTTLKVKPLAPIKLVA